MFNHILDISEIACNFLKVVDEIKPFKKLNMIQSRWYKFIVLKMSSVTILFDSIIC